MSQKQTVVLVNPRATYVNEIAQKCYPPASLLYLAAALENAGFGVAVIDANAFGLTDDKVAAEIASARPFLVGFSVYSEILPQIRGLCRLARKAAPQAKIVLGGPHATAIPETTLSQFPEADFLLSGEAEESLPLLCAKIFEGAPPSEVPGAYFRDEAGKIVQGPPYRLPDVALLPRPAKHLVARAYREKRYYSLLVRQKPVDTLFSSRGCPFRCGFCYNFRRSYRARTPLDVVDELCRIRESGIRDVEVCDDTFTVNEERALEIFRLIRAERLDVSFRIKSRVDVFTERLAAEAKRAGVYLVAFGMESGSQQILDIMEKRITREQCERARRLCRENGMACHSSWVVGYPGESPETVAETADFIVKLKPTTANVALLRPYPQTPAYLMAKESGTLVGDWSPEAADFPWVRLPWANEKRVLDGVVKKMMRRIYFRPYYAASFGKDIAVNMNFLLLRYAFQEAKKVVGL